MERSQNTYFVCKFEVWSKTELEMAACLFKKLMCVSLFSSSLKKIFVYNS